MQKVCDSARVDFHTVMDMVTATILSLVVLQGVSNNHSFKIQFTFFKIKFNGYLHKIFFSTFASFFLNVSQFQSLQHKVEQQIHFQIKFISVT